MPLYEYQCSKCKRTLEKFSTISNRKDIINCICGYTAKRIISSSFFKINGYNESNGYAKEK